MDNFSRQYSVLKLEEDIYSSSAVQLKNSGFIILRLNVIAHQCTFIFVDDEMCS